MVQALIYDCFIFYNELDILEMRLNILEEVVDKFVLVEATKTFSNKEKQMVYQNNKDRYKKFSDKIIHIVVDDFPAFETAWHYENYQRNAILRGLKDCDPEDIIIVSDVDEIPDPKILQNLKVKMDEVVCICLRVYWYYLNYLKITDPVWRTASIKIVKYATFTSKLDERFVIYSNLVIKEMNNGVTPNKLRYYRDCRFIFDGGWHFSYMGGVGAVSDKLKNFAHQEFNDEQHTNIDTITDHIKAGINVCTGAKEFRSVEIDDYFPDYIVNNIEKYSSHIIDVNKYNRNKTDVIIAVKTLESVFRAYIGKIKYVLRK